jgi:hypothetical protein
VQQPLPNAEPNLPHRVYTVRMKWKVTIVGPTGTTQASTAFELLYPFATREEAEAHAECFRFAGTKIVPCDEPATPAENPRLEGN